MWRSRFYQGLNLALLAILAWLPLGGITKVSANHENYVPLQAIRSVAWQETFCVEDAQSSLAFADVYGRINATLTWENPGGDWHQLNGNKIYFEDAYVATGVGCNGLNDWTAIRRTDVEIEYHAQDDNQLDPRCRGTSCAIGYGVTWSYPGGAAQQYYNVYLRTAVLQGDDYGDPNRRRHGVNHESGHVFGLADGGPASESWDKSCPYSIMHAGYYGCPYGNPPWPTANDFATVTNITNR